VPKTLRASIYVPDQAPARRVTLLLDGKAVASQTFDGPGVHTIETTSPVRGSDAAAVVAVEVDKSFFAPPDQRELGVVLTGLGFAP
jgi:hypothetical protein